MGSGLELRARRADGSEVAVEVSLSPLPIGDDVFTVAAVRDISERVRAEDHLRRVLHTLDASDDGMFIFDAESLRYSYVNEGAVRLTGYSPDELATMTPLHLNATAHDLDYRRLIEALDGQPNQAVVRQTVLLRKDGIEIPVEKTYQSAPPGRDGTKWIIALARDSSARLHAEEALRRSQEALARRAAGGRRRRGPPPDRPRSPRHRHPTALRRRAQPAGNRRRTPTPRPEIGSKPPSPTSTRPSRSSARRSSRCRTVCRRPGRLRGRLLDVIGESRVGLGFEPKLRFDGPIETMDDAIADHLVPTLREALSNIARHARAHQVRVTITVTRDAVTLTVSDDGTGIPTRARWSRPDQPGRSGRPSAEPSPSNPNLRVAHCSPGTHQTQRPPRAPSCRQRPSPLPEPTEARQPAPLIRNLRHHPLGLGNLQLPASRPCPTDGSRAPTRSSAS